MQTVNNTCCYTLDANSSYDKPSTSWHTFGRTPKGIQYLTVRAYRAHHATFDICPSTTQVGCCLLLVLSLTNSPSVTFQYVIDYLYGADYCGLTSASRVGHTVNRPTRVFTTVVAQGRETEPHLHIQSWCMVTRRPCLQSH